MEWRNDGQKEERKGGKKEEGMKKKGMKKRNEWMDEWMNE